MGNDLCVSNRVEIYPITFLGGIKWALSMILTLAEKVKKLKWK